MNPPSESSKTRGHSWYEHPAYQRFWTHYSQVMTWCHAQRQSYQTSMYGSSPPYPPFSATNGIRPMDTSPSAQFPSPCRGIRPMATSVNNTSPHTNHSYNISDHACRARPQRHQRHGLKRPRVVTPDTSQKSSENERSDVEGEDLEMEITDEMKDFLRQSEKHRLERDARKAEKATQEKAEPHVDITASGHRMKTTVTEEAPKERPGVRRTFEMKKLYGADAAKIHGMETAMQLTFDRNCDRFQPKLWPIMPFKIKFS